MDAATRRPALARRLIEQGLLSSPQADRIVTEARRTGRPLVQQLLDSGVLSPATIADTAAQEFGMERVAAEALEPDPDLLAQVDAEIIRRHHALPLQRQGDTLRVAVSDPANVAALNELRFHTDLPVEPVLTDDDALGARIAALSGGDAALADELASASRSEGEIRDVTGNQTDDDTPVIRYINELLRRAIREQASDIHLEPFERHCRVRFRRDGMLHEVAHPPVDMADRLVARLKVMARMDIAERRLPQDGRLRLENEHDDAVDFRVSTVPTLFGEKLVLRLLDATAAGLGLEALGLEADQLATFRAAINRPHGMILVTGPTGSGKTVTLYSALQQLNHSSRNILTVEDPVEIKLPGINQISVNSRIGLDFPETLRAFLRQDPDIMMVGEIRDRETAEIAIKAAQTGHLVLSTLHTNDAPGAITRLVNMGIPRWNIAASVILVSAQRLVRRLCPHCCTPAHIPASALGTDTEVGMDLATSGGFFDAVGCNRCVDGYRGRLGIHEVMPMTEAITTRILHNDRETAIADELRGTGLQSLRDAGLAKAAQGQTSLSEIDRVTRG